MQICQWVSVLRLIDPQYMSGVSVMGPSQGGNRT